MSGFTKLDSALTASSIWNEPDPVRIVWVTMLSLADKDGNVKGSVVGLAHLARKTLDETQNALAILEAPDPHSGRKEEDGRRVVPFEGGWHLVNHAFYREAGMSDQQLERTREKTKERVKRYRALHSVTPASELGLEGLGEARGKGMAEQIYAVYPRKVARPEALRAISKAIEKVGAAVLMDKTQLFAAAWEGKPDRQFIPHPATWFNQERYNDDPSTWRRSDAHQKTAAKGSRTTGTANERRIGQYDRVGKVRTV